MVVKKSSNSEEDGKVTSNASGGANVTEAGPANSADGSPGNITKTANGTTDDNAPVSNSSSTNDFEKAMKGEAEN